MNTTPLDHTPTILVIDDDPSATKLIGKLLLLKGYKVLTANTGAEGLELLKQNPVDLVILDLLMPKMHGWEVCAEIKGFSSVPILIISAIDSPKMISKTLDKGADDYLPKPVTANILLARLETLIRRYAYEKYATSPLPES
ncbi:MAG: response regulator [Anaerolineales bacterium]|nr:response regulator [Anaerolineales bacterium]MBS3753385.1 response regulator [Anaerolineales bacterium]